MTEQKDFKYGLIVPIPEEYHVAIGKLIDGYKDAHTAFQTASNMLRIRNKDLHDFVRGVMPQTEGWEYNLEFDENRLILLMPERKDNE
jgi:hypothetical protein